MLTPAYYSDNLLRAEIDALIDACQQEQLRHPLLPPEGIMPSHRTPQMGTFGAGKGPTRKEQHHPAVDMHIGSRQTEASIHASHDGIVHTVREDPKRKYRHYIAITKTIRNDAGAELGKLTTIYGHVDLDLDEATGLKLDGKQVKAGDLISRHLWEGTMGGPHLHFEIRYYRPEDEGTEEFYGFMQKVPGAGDWPWGNWNPQVGYGYGDPANYGIK